MDFRETVRENRTKTRMVIATFIAIMFMVGFLADTAIRPIYPESLTANIIGYATLEAIPFVTLIIMGITVLGIWIISLKGHKIMLSGTNKKLLDRDVDDLDQTETTVLNIVEEMAISANLGYTPEVYIIETMELNAFAAGWHSKNALVGVTRGLTYELNRAELQAVIAHEIGHILHGDSKLTLYVGILANVVLTATNIFAHLAFFVGGRGNSSAANKARLIILLLNFVLPIVTQVLNLYLSRTREYMADAAAVQLTGDNTGMIQALEKISGSHAEDPKETDKTTKMGEHYRNAAYIYNKKDSFFSTHPSIENRIASLKGE